MNYKAILFSCLFTIAFYLVFEFIFANGTMGVPLDDTWIHFQFADNFSKGYFFQFNPGEPTAGTTSPLYVIVLAISGIVFRNYIIASLVVSSVFYIAVCVLICKLALMIFRKFDSLKNSSSNIFTPEQAALITSMLTVFAGRLAWSALSGMETTMFTFFCIAGAYYYIKNQLNGKFNLVPTIFFALASVSRPEGMLLFALYFIDSTITLIGNKEFQKSLVKVLLSLAIFCCLTFPYLIFSYSISGNFFPNTFRGQGGGFNFIPNFEFLRIAIVFFFRDNLLTGCLFVLTFGFYVFNIKKFFKEWKFVNLIFAWTIILPVALSFFIPNWRHHVRYLIPLIPFVNIAAIFVFINIFGKKYFGRIYDLAILKKKYVMPLIIAASLVYYLVYAVALGRNTANINDQQVKLAHWVINNVGRDETIAINDIGAITFLSKNRIVDMAGLVTPELLRYRTYTWDDNLDSTNSLLKKNNVSYIIIYDEWFKEFLNKFGSNFTYVTSAYLEDNTICGGEEMKVYKTNYNKADN